MRSHYRGWARYRETHGDRLRAARARLALIARSKAELDLAHIEIEQNGGNALRIRGDVADPEQMAVAIDRVRVAYGGVPDVLICAAGVAALCTISCTVR